MFPHRAAAAAFVAAAVLPFTLGCSESSGPAGEVVTPYTMVFFEHLNLDTGEQLDCQDAGHPGPVPCPAGFDFGMGYYDGVVPEHALVYQNESAGVQMAHLRGVTFGAVRAADTLGAGFTTSLIAEPFDNTRVILIRTDLGRIFKLGNPTETPGAGIGSRGSVTFDTAPLT